jgi:hypothetical protein
MRNVTRKLALAVSGLALSAGIAGAQQVTYSTSGVFTGCANGSGTNTCVVNGPAGSATLTFLGQNSTSYTAPVTGASFGDFALSATVDGPYSFAGVGFTLTVNQTAPSNGSDNQGGSFVGSFSFANTGSTGGPVVLNFTDYMLSVGAVNYTLQQDFGGGINMNLPGVNENPASRSLRANISTVPEPSTYMLLGSGLAALGMIARRRRSNV